MKAVKTTAAQKAYAQLLRDITINSVNKGITIQEAIALLSQLQGALIATYPRENQEFMATVIAANITKGIEHPILVVETAANDGIGVPEGNA